MKTKCAPSRTLAGVGAALALLLAGCGSKPSDPTLEAAPPPPADAKPAAPAINKIRNDAAPVGIGPKDAAPVAAK